VVLVKKMLKYHLSPTKRQSKSLQNLAVLFGDHKAWVQSLEALDFSRGEWSQELLEAKTKKGKGVVSKVLTKLGRLFKRKPKKSKADLVPAQLRHCMLAVAKKKNGRTKKGALAAWNICRWHLTKYGYMKKPYRKNAKVRKSNLRMTQKGSRANMRHAMEKGVKKKNKRFRTLFKKLEKQVS
jgi:hypothetical protein